MDVKFPIFLRYMVVIWPVLSYADHANAIILTFISFMADIVMYIKKYRDLVYSEFAVITGKYPTRVQEHIWLTFVISTRTMQIVSVWSGVICVHMFSPIYGAPIPTRVMGLYIATLFYVFCEAIYHKIYKKWAIGYCSVSTNDAELPFTRRQAFN